MASIYLLNDRTLYFFYVLLINDIPNIIIAQTTLLGNIPTVDPKADCDNTSIERGPPPLPYRSYDITFIYKASVGTKRDEERK